MQMIMFVLDNPNRLDEVLSAWDAVGVSGVTVVESTGFQRRQAYILGTRYVPTDSALMGRIEEGHYTLFAVVPNAQVAQQCLNATEQVVGDLDQPNTGILVAWDIALSKGVPNTPPNTPPNTLPNAGQRE